MTAETVLEMKGFCVYHDGIYRNEEMKCYDFDALMVDRVKMGRCRNYSSIETERAIDSEKNMLDIEEDDIGE
ncbi:hypothetical protein F2Q69_00037223 [Brassica cretica]|uniref:Uncharacterized protein n=1 Tax=Brassica cretica TaxID=69181 RepID=A0A8S9STU5_BRACR|nr:hypothetical protein F2Q69_00037223 [Brassica cretica]